MDRRQMMKTVGVVAGAAAAGQPALADHEEDDEDEDEENDREGITGFVFNPLNQTAPTYIATAKAVVGDVNEDPTVGDVSFHQTATSAYETWAEVSKVHLDNAITNASQVANIQARNAIAKAWEAGHTVEEARDFAITAIRDYWSVIYRNAFVSKIANAAQLGAISETYRSLDNPDDSLNGSYDFWIVPDSKYSGSGSIVSEETYLKGGITETEIELPNFETVTVQTIGFKAEWDNGDSWQGQIDDDLLSHYDPDADDFIGIETDQGETFDNNFQANVVSLPENNLQGRKVMDLRELASTLNDLEQKVDDVIQAYPLTFVDDLYSALDNGTITPGQVRGVEGLAEHLSGSTEASEGRYQVALATLLGVNVSDLSEVSTVTAAFTGATDINPVTDDSGNTDVFYSDHVQNQPLVGQLFASTVENIYQGGRYAVDDLVIHNAGNGYTARDSQMNEQWYSDTGSFGSSVAYTTTDGRYLLTGDMELINLENGRVLWDRSGDPYGVPCLTPGREVWGGDDDSNLIQFNFSSGGEGSAYDLHESYGIGTGKTINVMASGPDGERILVHDDTDDNWYLFDITAGIEMLYENTDSNRTGVRSGAATPEGDFVVAYSDSSGVRRLRKIDRSGEVVWSIQEAVNHVGVAANGTILAGEFQGSRLWEVDESGDSPSLVETGWGGSEIAGTITPSSVKHEMWIGTLEEFHRYDVNEQSIVYTYNDDTGAMTVDQYYHQSHGGPIDAADSHITDVLFADVSNEELNGDTGSQELYLSGILQIDQIENSDGEEVKPWDDIEDVLNEIDEKYDGNLDDLIDSIDGIDGRDDVDSVEDIRLILGEIPDLTIEDIDAIDRITWEPPEYDTADLEEYANYLEKVAEEYESALEDLGSPDFSVPGGGWFDGGLPTLPGLNFVQSVVVVILGFVGLNVATS